MAKASGISASSVRTMARHRHQEFIRLLNPVNAAVPVGKSVHVILDNYAAHKHAKGREGQGQNPRFTCHFTPRSCSWLNAVEGFFATLTIRRLKRGVFTSVVDPSRQRAASSPSIIPSPNPSNGQTLQMAKPFK